MEMITTATAMTITIMTTMIMMEPGGIRLKAGYQTHGIHGGVKFH